MDKVWIVMERNFNDCPSIHSVCFNEELAKEIEKSLGNLQCWIEEFDVKK